MYYKGSSELLQIPLIESYDDKIVFNISLKTDKDVQVTLVNYEQSYSLNSKETSIKLVGFDTPVVRTNNIEFHYQLQFIFSEECNIELKIDYACELVPN